MGGTVDQELAFNQWNTLKSTIEAQGVEVLTLEQAPTLPDMVFVCNSGIALDNRVYLSHFYHPERQGEEAHYLDYYRDAGYEVWRPEARVHFEGGGDACFSDRHTLWAGHGVRTSKKAYDKIANLGDFEIVYCELDGPRFYHLDTAFAPIGVNSALWYPPAFSADTQKEITKRMPKSIAVSQEEAYQFVCNAITVGSTVILPPGLSDDNKAAINDLGYETAEVDMSEFMKSGGAMQCLVMKL